MNSKKESRGGGGGSYKVKKDKDNHTCAYSGVISKYVDYVYCPIIELNRNF